MGRNLRWSALALEPRDQVEEFRIQVSDMNIVQLKYILEIAGSSSMREAASKLYVTQPALSASIRELEEELGILRKRLVSMRFLRTDICQRIQIKSIFLFPHSTIILRSRPLRK